MHQNEKGRFATGLTELAGFTGLKNPVIEATIYNQVPI
jgi:hypothetical protein